MYDAVFIELNRLTSGEALRQRTGDVEDGGTHKCFATNVETMLWDTKLRRCSWWKYVPKIEADFNLTRSGSEISE